MFIVPYLWHVLMANRNHHEPDDILSTFLACPSPFLGHAPEQASMAM